MVIIVSSYSFDITNSDRLTSYHSLKLYSEYKIKSVKKYNCERKKVIDIEKSIRDCKPTKSQIRETLILLSDFNIKDVKVPEFNTYSDMLRWRKKIILNSLSA